MKRKTIICALLLVVFTLLAACTPTAPADVQPTAKGFDEIGGTSPTPETPETPTPTLLYTAVEVEPVEKPDKTIEASFYDPPEIDIFFMMMKCAVHCKVLGIREFMYTGQYENTGEIEEQSYCSLLSVGVLDVYGDAKVADTVNVYYCQSSHEKYKGVAELAVGDECVLFLADISTNPVAFTLPNAEIDYTIISPEISVCKCINGRYSAHKFMSLVGENGDTFTLKMLAKAINRNSDLFLGESLEAALIEWLERCEEQSQS